MSVSTTRPTTSALWRDDHPSGDRLFQPIGDLVVESGEVLPDVVLAYETWGRLSPSRDNAVLVEHALTGDSHVVGERGPDTSEGELGLLMAGVEHKEAAE